MVDAISIDPFYDSGVFTECEVDMPTFICEVVEGASKVTKPSGVDCDVAGIGVKHSL